MGAARIYVNRKAAASGELAAGSLGDIQRKSASHGFRHKQLGMTKRGRATHECVWIRGHDIEVCVKCGADRALPANT